MFKFLSIISLMASIVGVVLLIIDTEYAYILISGLISTLLCWRISIIEERSSQNEDEIAKLKKHLHIKDGDRVDE